jgi:sigma-B regulation protein RsbU (phosphoserine phosphatase)
MSAAREILTPLEEQLAEHLRQAFVVLPPIPGCYLKLRTAGGNGADILADGPFPGDQPETVFPIEQAPGSGFVLSYPEPAGIMRSLIEATIRTTIEKADVERREELLLDELGANWESLEALYEISTDILRFGDITNALQRLIDRFASLQEGLKSVLFLSRGGRLEPVASNVRGLAKIDWSDLGAVEKHVRQCRSVVINEPGSGDQIRSGAGRAPEHAPWQTATSLAAAPVTSRQQTVIGLLLIWRQDRRFVFDAPFSRLLEAITYQASMLLESSRLNRTMRENERLAQEIEIASSIQQMLLLGNPPSNVPGIEMASFSAASQRIDGDFHDFLRYGNAVDVLIGDVMGKGVAAALLGAATKSQFLRAIAKLAIQTPGGIPDPVAIVRRAASRLGDQLIALERFVTLCYARFDPERGVVEYVDCGHTGIMVHRKQTGETFVLKGEDLPLGVRAVYECTQNSAPLVPGDTFLLFSDGVTETRGPDGELFGDERLLEAVEQWSSLGPELLLRQVRKQAAEFSDFQPQADDFTCIAVRIRLSTETEPLFREYTRFPCDLKDLGPCRAWLRKAADLIPGGGLGAESQSRLELAVTEAFVNSVLHGSSVACPQTVRLQAEIFSNHLRIEMRHDGPCFDPLLVANPIFDGSKEGGFGTFIIMRLADELVYGREDETNLIAISIMRSQR